MCGIGLCIKCELPATTIDQLKRRGPDFYQRRDIDDVSFYAAILSHQGAELTRQEMAYFFGIFWNLISKK